METVYWILNIILKYHDEAVLNRFFDVLQGLNIKETSIVEDMTHSILGESKYDIYFEDSDVAKRIQLSIENDYDFDLVTHIRKLESEDWKEKWKENIKIIDLVADYKVKNISSSDDIVIDDKLIYIDTDLVFGAGNHPTTKLVANYIYQNRANVESFFDIGTGTGILSILAARCGAKTIWALDIEHDAVENTKSNLALNNCNLDKLTCSDFNDFDDFNCFDFVAANVLSKYLVEMRKKILKYVKLHGFLAVSGISDKNYEWFLNEFNGDELELIDESQEGGWHAALYKKIR